MAHTVAGAGTPPPAIALVVKKNKVIFGASGNPKVTRREFDGPSGKVTLHRDAEEVEIKVPSKHGDLEIELTDYDEFGHVLAHGHNVIPATEEKEKEEKK